jgi:hypothetical protein
MNAKAHFKNRVYLKSHTSKREMNKMLICSMFGTLLSLFAISAFGQPQKFSREQMIQDIDTLFSTIEKVHPDMYAVYPKELLDKDIERIKSELEQSGDIFYFYRQVAPLVVKLGDGHTNFFPPIRGSEDLANLALFPLSVKITYPDKEIFVRDVHNAIPAEAQITSINNKSAKEIVREMMNYSSGEKDFFRIDKLQQLFPLLMGVLYGDSNYNIDYLFNQEKYTVQLKTISFNEISELLLQLGNIAHSELYTFKTMPEKNIGIIEFNQFTDMDNFKVFLDSTFQVLQKENIENLIIDIRANGGGNSILGDELFQYISPVPFAQFGKNIVKYSDIQKQYAKAVNNREVTNPNGIETYNENMELIELRENNLRYKGNVYLLISHSTFSSAASFSWAFKYFKMGTVVGEETGGMAVCFGDVISQKLPISGLFYGMSYKKFYQYGATDDNIHGTLPDYEIEAENALDFTIDLITRRQ